jgi:putative SOS response-associated peptidase YedK
MCGYIGNVHQAPGVIDLMMELGITLPLPYFKSHVLQMHPALITAGEGEYHLSEAMWWYAMKKLGGQWEPDTSITCFNARNLGSPMWKPALETHRGVIFGTEIGESKDKNRYLMRSPTGLAIGAVYKDWSTPDAEPLRSMAVITRPPHPRFSQYHDKAIPLFLPLKLHAIKTWLDPTVGSNHPDIRKLLENPKIYTPLTVTKVKTFVRAEPLGEPEELAADE